MFARVFACYVKDKVKHNDYLCGLADTVMANIPDGGGGLRTVRAYPVGEEREHINLCMDVLIKDMKDRNLLQTSVKNVGRMPQRAGGKSI